MGKVILCVGRYAEIPYYLESGGVRIYSVEELCYFLRENALLLDAEIMKPELAEWLKSECELPELAKEMKRYLKEKKTLNEYVGLIMNSIHYCTEAEWKEMDRLLTESRDWNSDERIKGRTDYHFHKGKYLYALLGYENLYHEIKEKDSELSAKILHNLGTVYAKLFLFEVAASYYKQAYDQGAGESSYFSYLAANRMYMTEPEYVDFAARQEGRHADLLTLEKRVEAFQAEYTSSDMKKQLDELAEWKNSQKMAEYYHRMEQMVADGKEAYRNNALEM